MMPPLPNSMKNNPSQKSLANQTYQNNVSFNNYQPPSVNQLYSAQQNNNIHEMFYQSLGMNENMTMQSQQMNQFPDNQNSNMTIRQQSQRQQIEQDSDTQTYFSCNNQTNPSISHYQQNMPLQRPSYISQDQSRFNQQQLQQNTGRTSFRTAMDGPTNQLNNPINGHQQRPSMFMDIQKELEELKTFDEIFADSQRQVSAPTQYRGGQVQPVQGINSNMQSNAKTPQENTLNRGDFRMMNNNTNNYQPMMSSSLKAQLEQTNNFAPQNKELLTITVDIGDGTSQSILIRENDDPFILASQFAQQYGINEQLRDLLAEQIRVNIDSVIQEDAQTYNNQNQSSGQQQFNQYLSESKQQQQQDQHVYDLQYQDPMSFTQTLNSNPNGSFDTAGIRAEGSFMHQQNSNNNLNSSFQNQSNQRPYEYHNQNTNQLNNISNVFSQQNYPQTDNSIINKTQSIVEDNNRSALYNNPNGISGMINQSYLTDRSGQSQRLFQQPGSQVYQQWRNNLENKMQLIDHKNNQPKINDNSKRMIESKRFNNSGQKNNSVHSRLHQQAVSKQRSLQRQQQQLIDQQQQMSKNRSFVNNNSGSKLINQKFQNQIGNTNRSFTQSGRNSPNRGNYQDPIGQLQKLKQINNDLSHRNIQNARGSIITTKQSSERTFAPLPKPILNYGERLYQKGIKRKEEIERHIREAKNHQEQEEQEQFTYQPQINNISRSLPRNEDNLLKYGQQTRERIEQKRTELLLQEQSECLFRPMITKKSAKLLSERYNNNGESLTRNGHGSKDKFSNLYEDARRRKERQDKIYSACVESECTFQPDTQVTKYYYQRMESKDPNKTGMSNFDRANSRDNSMRKNKNNTTLNNDLFDPESGQPFFKPKVGRGPRKQHRPDPKDQPGGVSMALYDQSKALRQKIEDKKQRAIEERDNQAKTVFTRDHTNRIVEKMKLQKFSELFKQLDSDGDGQVSANRIDISKLSPELLEVLTPLFCEMEELGQTLDEDEFIDAAGRLYDSVPLPQKNIILQTKQKWSEKSKIQQDLQFKPQLNPNSLKIAASKRPKEDVADILLRKKQEYNQKVYEKLQEKENMELVGCTFHPKILQSPQSEGNNSFRNYPRSSSKGFMNRNHANINLNHSQQSLNLNHSHNYGMKQPVSSSFDINNLAQNIANEIYSKQIPHSTTNNPVMNNLLRGGNGLPMGQRYNNQDISNSMINNENAYNSSHHMAGGLGTYKNQGFNTLEPSRLNNFSGTNPHIQDMMGRDILQNQYQQQQYRGIYGSQGRSENSQKLIMMQ
ncbi:UNKNOWN [Stylonychia lemnae]|uniref:EF-hand domain-containing protein n=1 Tax=Stylonychia lemnae TaxID=5949 RepID=A0A078BBY9_STYLE|nr:UNKNOWN [Stylonychia lemnae]|eukprot:CDW91726.1 UNKNOWN [Stylonychia lemnae]